MSSAPRLAALAVLFLLGPLFFALQITHDAAWQMWIGRQMLHGANLYSDIVEINPPLWFWLAQPLSAVGQALGVGSLQTLVFFFLACIAASVVLTDRLMEQWSTWRRGLFLVVFVLLALPPANFAQREHFTFVAVTPYVVLVGRRLSTSAVSPRLALLIGCFAALGFALKPQFALVPLALELWLRKSVVRPETLAVGALAVLYGAAVLILEPDYLTEAVPLAQRAYGDFAPLNPVALLPTTLPFVIALVARPWRKNCTGALLVASLTFYLIYVLQLKGFAYQVIPAMGMLVLALAASAQPKLSVGNALAFAAAIFAVAPNIRPYHTAAWADVPSGASYAALSVAPRAGWPLVEERGLKWPLRSISLWMAPALGSAVRPSVAKDLNCHAPDYLLVDDRLVNFSEMFRNVLAHYVTVEQRDSVKLMKSARALPKPQGCRTIY